MYLVGNLKEMKVEDMRLQKYFKMFKGKDEDGQLEIIRKLLEDAGFHHEIAIAKNGAKTEWFWKEGIANVFAFAISKQGDHLLLLIPMDYARDRYTNKKGEFTKCIHLDKRHDGNVIAKHNNYRLPEDIYRYRKIDYKLPCFDHICHHTGVNVDREIRNCTFKQNNINTRNSKVKDGGEYTYNNEHDFRDSFWIPFLHYVLDVISYEDMDELRRMELKTQDN